MLRLLSRKMTVAAAAALGLGAGGGLAVAAAVGTSAPAEKDAALGRLASVATTDSSTEPASAPDFDSQPIPGRMLGPDVPVPVAPSVLQPQNGWLVSDGTSLVAVYAGVAGDDPVVGRVVVVRQNLVAGRQTVDVVDAGATGPLTITAAPLGGSVETSALTGSIGLRTAQGRSLRLDLGTGRFARG